MYGDIMKRRYCDIVGEEVFHQQVRTFFRQPEEEKKEENWYWLVEEGALAGYWQMCLNDQELEFRKAEGYVVGLLKSQRVWIHNSPLSLTLCQDGVKGYK